MQRPAMEVFILLAVTFVLGGGVYRSYQHRPRTEDTAERFAAVLRAADRNVILSPNEGLLLSARGWSGIAIAYFDVGCTDCGAAYRRFADLAASSRFPVAFAVVPFASEKSASARSTVMSLLCAAIQDAHLRVMSAVFERSARLDDPVRTAQMLALPNAPDFVSCVREGRLEARLRRMAWIADSLGAERPLVVVAAPAPMDSALANALAGVTQLRLHGPP